jgi:Putative Flp pilus-assembly TadE/G-like
MGMHEGQRGQVLPLVAICLAVLMGFAAMAIDVGFLEYRQRQQQNAADAAAVGGAQQLVYSGCVSGAGDAAAQSDSSTNGFTNGTNGVVVTVNNPPATGPYAGNNCAVQVQITNNQTQTFFSRIFGFTAMPESTQAVAAALANNNDCAYLLDRTATPDFHGAKINGAGCGMIINGSPTFDGGGIALSSIGYAGTATIHGNPFTLASPMPALPAADPCPEIAGCNYLANNPPSTTNCTALTATGSSINPGCYSSISGSFSTMNPGLYVLTGPVSLSGGTVTGSGVTIDVADGGSLDMHGITGDLTACTSSCTGGAVSNVLYYQPSSNTNSMTFAGPQSTYSGLIYAPGADVTYDGNAGTGYTVLVFGTWTLNGTGQGMDFTPPTQGQSFLYQAVLVQ